MQQTLRDFGFELRERRRSEIFDDGQFASSFNQIWVRMISALVRVCGIVFGCAAVPNVIRSNWTPSPTASSIVVQMGVLHRAANGIGLGPRVRDLWPVSNQCRDLRRITFNGEIYNYRELRQDLRMGII